MHALCVYGRLYVYVYTFICVCLYVFGQHEDFTHGASVSALNSTAVEKARAHPPF